MYMYTYSSLSEALSIKLTTRTLFTNTCTMLIDPGRFDSVWISRAFDLFIPNLEFDRSPYLFKVIYCVIKVCKLALYPIFHVHDSPPYR